MPTERRVAYLDRLRLRKSWKYFVFFVGASNVVTFFAFNASWSGASFSNGLLLPNFLFVSLRVSMCGCVTFAYALRQHQCFFLLCFALNTINLFPVLYILFNKSFQKVFTLDSLSNIKGWCVWVCVWVSVGVCRVYNKVPHFIVEITVYYEIFGLDFSFTMHRWKGCVGLKVRWKSSRLPYIRVGANG